MSLFHPRYLGCPICNTEPNYWSGSSLSAFECLGGYRYRSHKCGHEFHLYESLKKQCSGTGGIIETFAHWEWSGATTIVVGRVERIPLPIPDQVSLFAVFFTPFTPPESPQVVYLPKAINLDSTGILLTTTAAMNTEAESLGSKMQLEYSVYGYVAERAPGWMRLLYESLTDFNDGRSLLAIFKLATSVEILCDRTFEKYLNAKGIPEQLQNTLLKSGRCWSGRFDRVAKAMPEYLTSSEVEEFRSSKNAFDKAVRKLRDRFAHDDPATATHQDAKKAFNSSVPILWALDRLQDILTEKSAA